jgi:predicted nucleic-acid-binding protein
MRAVDINVLVRLLTRDDARQVKAAEAFVASGAWISHLVLAESIWVLSAVYGLKPGEIATAVDMLLSHKTLSVQEPHVVECALAHFRGKPALSFSDCLVLEIARKASHLPLGAFDKNLAKLPDAERL